jgi:hypothetical protein
MRDEAATLSGNVDRCKPQRIAHDGAHWFVDYEFMPGHWTHLSIPLGSAAEAVQALNVLRCPYCPPMR